MRILKNGSMFSIDGINCRVHSSNGHSLPHEMQSTYKWLFKTENDDDHLNVSEIVDICTFKSKIDFYLNVGNLYFKTLPDMVRFLGDLMQPTISKQNQKNTIKQEENNLKSEIVGYKIKREEWIDLFEEVTDIKYKEDNGIAFHKGDYLYEKFSKLNVIDILFTPITRSYIFKGSINDNIIINDNSNNTYILSYEQYKKFIYSKIKSDVYISENISDLLIQYNTLTHDSILELTYDIFLEFIQDQPIIFISKEVIDLINL